LFEVPLTGTTRPQTFSDVLQARRHNKCLCRAARAVASGSPG